tara:strand:+ start:1085 stop:1366 length:282 start_codon:yes stop_codon:yes gene_type:complete
MQSNVLLKNMIPDLIPKEINLIILEYLKEDVMIEEIKTLVKDDLCYGDCQTTYDSPLPLCRDCQNIVDKIKELNNLRISIGKDYYSEEKLWKH